MSLASLQVYSSLAHVAEVFNGILLDAYGVFWGGGAVGLLPGAKEAMEKLVSNGKMVGILSNATQLAAKEKNKLLLHGITQGKHFHFLVTSGEVAREVFLHQQLPFQTPRHQFLVFGEGKHPQFSSYTALFEGTSYIETSDIDAADFIYVDTPHILGKDQTNPELFYSALEQLKRKLLLPMICPNPDLFAHEGNPPKAVVRQGTIAALYEKMGGKVHYMGKPHEQAYSFAMRHFLEQNIQHPKEILMVGDTPETDIRGARKFGMSSALVTQTGIMAARISQRGWEGALLGLATADHPHFLIERL